MTPLNHILDDFKNYLESRKKIAPNVNASPTLADRVAALEDAVADLAMGGTDK